MWWRSASRNCIACCYLNIVIWWSLTLAEMWGESQSPMFYENSLNRSYGIYRWGVLTGSNIKSISNLHRPGTLPSRYKVSIDGNNIWSQDNWLSPKKGSSRKIVSRRIWIMCWDSNARFLMAILILRIIEVFIKHEVFEKMIWCWSKDRISIKGQDLDQRTGSCLANII